MKPILLKRIIFWGGILSLLLSWQIYENWPVTVQVRGSIPKEDFSISMPRKDKKRLEFFFRETCLFETWAYTLMGKKPISLYTFATPSAAFFRFFDLSNLKEAFSFLRPPTLIKKTRYVFYPYNLKSYLGWKTFQKYLPLFARSRYLLFERSLWEGTVTEIVLADRLQCEKMIQSHLEDFQKILNTESINSEQLLEDLKSHPFKEALLDHDALLGILLGFGRENAWAYFEREQGKEIDLSSVWEEEIEMQNLEQTNQRALNCEPWDLPDLFYPRFAAHPNSQETEDLRQLYRATREEIIHYYEGKDFVEATLSLFNKSVR